MQIDFKKFRIKIGIRDFVSFAQSSYPAIPMSQPGNWRTAIGQQWHQQLWQETRSLLGEQARSETAVEGSISYKNWTFDLSGRIDQILYEPEHTLLREVKTTQQLLPRPTEELKQIYPDYFEQLACYLLLMPESLKRPGIPVLAELLMLHIDTGIRQLVILDQPPLDILKTRLDTWLDYLEGQRRSNDRIQHLVVPEAFETFREDQIPVRELLFRQLKPISDKEPASLIAMEAATGFGKTSIAIEWALQGLKRAVYDRVIYLTGKNTGQKQVVDELARFRAGSAGIRYFQVRNMESHLQICPHSFCPCRHRNRDGTEQLQSYIPFLKTETLIAEGSPDMESIGLSASTYHVCPRIISQSALALSEFWVGDYNYVFSPGARGLMEAIPGYEPRRTLLILDEAHNLHERVCSNFSLQFRTFQGEQLLSALRSIRAPRTFLSAIDALIRFIARLEERQVLDTTSTYQLKDLLESTHQQIVDNGRVLIDLEEAVFENLWSLETAWQSVQNPQLELLMWCSRNGTLDITCIDASAVIRDTLNSYGNVLCMSATFPSAEVFERQTGIPSKKFFRIQSASEWRTSCYDVAIDSRISTTYKNRERNYRKTSQTLVQLKDSGSSPVIAFFPSYQYAESIAEYAKVMAPHLNVFTLPRGMLPEDQIDAIDLAVSTSDILCLPLGSGLSEGIDLLGGRVDTVMVVSPALPEVNPVQEARSERFHRQDTGFHHVYLVPGMTKVNQALGRLVRSPEHRAKVLLHCERFADNTYRDLLAPEYQKATVIRNDRDFEYWLNTRKPGF